MGKREWKRRDKLLIAGGAVLAALVLALGGCLIYVMSYGKVFPGVSVAGLDLSGQTREQAVQALTEYAGEQFAQKSLTVREGEREYTQTFAQLPAGVDVEETVDQAYQIGRTGNVFHRLKTVFSLRFHPRKMSLTLHQGEEELEQLADQLAGQVEEAQPLDYFSVSGDQLLVDLSGLKRRVDRASLGQAIGEHLCQLDETAIDLEDLDAQQAQVDWDAVKAQVDQPVQDARVDTSVKGSTTILPEQVGITLDVDTARKIAETNTGEQYSVPLTLTQPNMTAQTLQSMLFRDQLASSYTSFSTANRNRAHNIRLAAQLVDGTVLNPGEEFSYNDVVGSRTTARGFKDAGVFSNGQVTEGVGGGICQVSSTIYMAVLRADLEVVQRRNHSLVVGYTPIGQDATVYYGAIEFIFKNNTAYPVRINASINGGRLTISIDGTKTDDKKVEIFSQVVETYPYQTIRREVSTMAPGTERVVQRPYTGYLVKVYKTVTVNGQSTTTLVNTSQYKKLDRIIECGPAASTATAPTTPTTPTTPTAPAEETAPAAENETGADPESAA